MTKNPVIVIYEATLDFKTFAFRRPNSERGCFEYISLLLQLKLPESKNIATTKVPLALSHVPNVLLL